MNIAQISQSIKVKFGIIVSIIGIDKRHNHYKLLCENQVVSNLHLQLFYIT